MTAAPENGYLLAQRAWDERTRSLVVAARNWRFTAFGSMVLTAAALALVAFLFAAGRHRIVPFVIGVNEMGRTVFAGVATEQRPNDNRVLQASIFSWIEKWRMLTSDAPAQAQAIKQSVYSFIAAGSPALAAINEWYRSSPPQERVKNGTITVEVQSVLQTSERVFEADWIERTWENGSMKSEERWRGSFSTVLSPPSDQTQALINPLGLYVTEASWTKVTGGMK